MFFLLSKKALLNEMVHNPEHKTGTGKETTCCLENRDCVLAVSFPETVVQTASPALYFIYWILLFHFLGWSGLDAFQTSFPWVCHSYQQSVALGNQSDELMIHRRLTLARAPGTMRSFEFSNLYVASRQRRRRSLSLTLLWVKMC